LRFSITVLGASRIYLGMNEFIKYHLFVIWSKSRILRWWLLRMDLIGALEGGWLLNLDCLFLGRYVLLEFVLKLLQNNYDYSQVVKRFLKGSRLQNGVHYLPSHLVDSQPILPLRFMLFKRFPSYVMYLGVGKPVENSITSQKKEIMEASL